MLTLLTSMHQSKTLEPKRIQLTKLRAHGSAPPNQCKEVYIKTEIALKKEVTTRQLRHL